MKLSASSVPIRSVSPSISAKQGRVDRRRPGRGVPGRRQAQAGDDIGHGDGQQAGAADEFERAGVRAAFEVQPGLPGDLAGRRGERQRQRRVEPAGDLAEQAQGRGQDEVPAGHDVEALLDVVLGAPDHGERQPGAVAHHPERAESQERLAVLDPGLDRGLLVEEVAGEPEDLQRVERRITPAQRLPQVFARVGDQARGPVELQPSPHVPLGGGPGGHLAPVQQAGQPQDEAERRRHVGDRRSQRGVAERLGEARGESDRGGAAGRVRDRGRRDRGLDRARDLVQPGGELTQGDAERNQPAEDGCVVGRLRGGVEVEPAGQPARHRERDSPRRKCSSARSSRWCCTSARTRRSRRPPARMCHSRETSTRTPRIRASPLTRPLPP